MTPTAKRLILDLFSTLRGEVMPVRALVAAGELLGIAENGIRVALARLVASGLVERDERGSYRLGPQAAAVQRHVVSWRSSERELVAWSGGWAAVHRGGRPALGRAARRREERALRFLGLRALVPGLAIRPDNLRGGVPALRERLSALGLDSSALVFEIQSLDARCEARARSLWDAAALLKSYRDGRRALAASAARLARLAPAAAMAESFRLGGRVIRDLALDPLLPDEIVSAREREALVAAMREYDRLGRARWADFMRSFGLPASRSALELRVGEAAGWLSRAAGAVA